MQISEALELLITLAVIYILFSVVASAVAELLLQLYRLKGRVLAYSVQRMLGPDAAERFYDLPVIMGLAHSGYITRVVEALITEQANKPGKAQTWLGRWSDPFREWLYNVRKSLQYRYRVEQIDPVTFSEAVSYLSGSNSPMPAKIRDKLRARLAPLRDEEDDDWALRPDLINGWFKQAMKVASRQYRRSTQVMLLFLGLLASYMTDTDSIEIVTAAMGRGGYNLNFAFGDLTLGHWMTAGAVALGAQYWFDLVGRLLTLRSQLPESVLTARPWGRAARRG